jgi:tripartite-type tricarboxylate transporter receptor subunit TctC
MKLPRRKFLHLAAGAAAQPALARIARAQSYPARPVRVIVPYAPGGPTDVFGRLIAQKLSEQLGRQFFVENIGGAGGNIGMGRAARADRDGHTVVMVATPLAINPSLYDTVPFDPIKDFDPVTLAVSTTTVLAVHPSVPAQTTRDLVALIRASPGKYSFASPGTGTPSHLLGELFRLSLKLDLVHVPFNSGGLAIGSTLAGHTLLSFGTPPPALPHLRDGKLRRACGH